MSFALTCKEELMKRKRNIIENKALILGMLLSGAKIGEAEFTFSSVNENITKYLQFLLKRVYKYEGVLEENKIQSNKFLHTFNLACNGALSIIEDLEIGQTASLKKQIEEI